MGTDANQSENIGPPEEWCPRVWAPRAVGHMRARRAPTSSALLWPLASCLRPPLERGCYGSRLGCDGARRLSAHLYQQVPATMAARSPSTHTHSQPAPFGCKTSSPGGAISECWPLCWLADWLALLAPADRGQFGGWSGIN